MSLLERHYIVSEHSMDDTWKLVREALEESSDENIWDITEDRRGLRLTATMKTQKALRLARYLTLEINFFQIDDGKVHLELNSDVRPMFDLGTFEKPLIAARSNIADKITSDGRVYAEGNLSPQDAKAKAQSEGGSGILKGLEMALAVNVGLFVIGAIRLGSPTQAILFVLSAQWLLVPVGLLLLGFGAKSPASRTGAAKVLYGVMAVGCGILVVVISIPIVLLGLCAGAIMFSPHY